MYFKSIEDILNSGILSERISEGFSDNDSEVNTSGT